MMGFSAREHLVGLNGVVIAGRRDTIPIYSSHRVGSARLFFAKDDGGAACILISAGKPSAGFPSFRTEVLTLEYRSSARISIEGNEEVHPVLALRCSDADDFVDILAALVDEIARAFSVSTGAETWANVASLLLRWSDFFQKPTLLAEIGCLGLWGELWLVSRASDRRATLESWRGSEGATYDFFRANTALEVKTTTRRGEHHVSHEQPSSEVYLGALVSIEALKDPEGTSLLDLERDILASIEDSFPYYEGLRRRGVSPLAISRAEGRWSLVGRPAVYRLSDVPRVLGAQPGVSELRYKVTLPESKRLSKTEETALLSPFGLVLDVQAG